MAARPPAAPRGRDRHLAEDLGYGGRNAASTFCPRRPSARTADGRRVPRFLDACFSGGILQELVDAIPHSFGTSTCSQKGYGYDESISAHGAWTETFLVEGLLRPGCHGGVDLVELFQQAYQAYVRRHPARGDRPCCFIRVGDRRYNTNDLQEPDQLPRGLLFARNLFGLE